MATAMKFTASSPVYVLAPNANRLDVIDQLQARQSQLAALLAMTHGEAGALLHNLSDSLRNDFMWACEMLAAEVQELTDTVLSMAEGGAA
ncbi:hypothetical protein [Zoogloea ramigera]|uniref:hypothetical protein n=1 Tax=Zoogloea ramigera TaxID=350 RepID=UPI003FA2FACD